MINFTSLNTKSSLPLIEVYLFEFSNIKVLILGKPDYSCFKYFRPSDTCLIKQAIIHENNQHYLNSPFRINLGNLRDINYQQIDIILLTDFKAYFLLPYIFRQKKIYTMMTQAMYEFGKLHSKKLREEIDNQNRYCDEKDFMQESEAEDQMEQEYDIDLREFVVIYLEDEWEAVQLEIECLNNGQVKGFSALEIVPFSSGVSIGECMWGIRVKADGSQVVVMLNGSVETWRHCKEMEIERIQNANYLILGQNVLNTQPEPIHPVNNTSAHYLTPFMTLLEKQLRKSNHIHLSFDSSIHILDFIQLLNYHHGTLFKQLIVSDSIFLNYLKFANSFVQYLNPIRSNNIHNNPPEYPFSNIYKLLDKGSMSVGKILDVARQQKLPKKQILLRFKPAIILYPTEFDYIGASDQKSRIKVPDQRIKVLELETLIGKIQPKAIISFQKGSRYYSQQKQLKLKLFPSSTFTITTHIDIFEQVYLKNGTILKKGLKKYRLVPKDWSEKIFQKLKIQIQKISTTNSSIETQHTKLILKDYTFQITSSSLEECQLIYKTLDNL